MVALVPLRPPRGQSPSHRRREARRQGNNTPKEQTPRWVRKKGDPLLEGWGSQHYYCVTAYGSITDLHCTILKQPWQDNYVKRRLVKLISILSLNFNYVVWNTRLTVLLLDISSSSMHKTLAYHEKDSLPLRSWLIQIPSLFVVSGIHVCHTKWSSKRLKPWFAIVILCLCAYRISTLQQFIIRLVETFIWTDTCMH